MSQELKAAFVGAAVALAVAMSGVAYNGGLLSRHVQDLERREARIERRLEDIQATLHAQDVRLTRIDEHLLGSYSRR